jgi:hypothetical protein
MEEREINLTMTKKTNKDQLVLTFETDNSSH